MEIKITVRGKGISVSRRLDDNWEGAEDAWREVARLLGRKHVGYRMATSLSSNLDLVTLTDGGTHGSGTGNVIGEALVHYI